MPYVLKRSHIISNSRESIIIGPLTSTELLINFVNLNPSGRFSDEVSSFRWERDGKIGRRISLFFGETEHFLDLPGAGDYFLKLFPSRYTFHFQIEVYEMALGVDLAALSLKTGIPEPFLRLQNSQIIQLLIGIDNSATIEGNKAAQDAINATNAAAIAAALVAQNELSQGLLDLKTSNIAIEAGLNNKASFYIHTQITASNVWTINHGLGRPVSITTFSPNGSEVIGSTSNSEPFNQSVIIFAFDFAGTAYCI